MNKLVQNQFSFTESSLILDGNIDAVPESKLIIGGDRRVNLNDLNRALKQCRIIDFIEGAISGSMVMMPLGIDIFRRFFEIVHENFESSGLEEHHYPNIVPKEFFSPVFDYLSLEQKLLHVGNDNDFSNGIPRATLCPTGEEVIYPHWHRKVKTKQDLPIEMYRQTTFYRPNKVNHRGGIFRSMESFDVFEFHCCYASMNQEKLRLFQRMLYRITDALHIPILWSDRPLITNNHKISHQTIAGDTLLPLRKTVQVSSIYNQGTFLSEKYQISYKEAGQSEHTAQITGFISRRAIWSALFNGLKEGDTFFLHPDLAPIQVFLAFKAFEPDLKDIQQIKKDLTDLAIRSQVEVLTRKDNIKSILKKNMKTAICLNIIVRPTESGYKLFLINALDEKEKEVLVERLDNICDLITEELRNIAKAHEVIVRSFVQRSVSFIKRKEEIDQKSFIQAIPLIHTDQHVLQLEEGIVGEILGFIPAQQEFKCSISEKPCDQLALIAKRL